MSDTNIGVAITADVTDLQTKLAIAQADLRAFSAETRTLATQMRASGDAGKAALLPALQTATSGASAAKAEIKTLTASVGEFGSTTHGSMSTATREFRALFDELSSGRTRQTPGTIAIIGQRVFGLGPAALGALGGVAALAAGLAYMAVQAFQANSALRAVQATLALRNVDIAKSQISDFVEQVHKLSGASYEDAQKVVAAFASMKNSAGGSIQFLIDLLPLFAQALGETLPEAAKRLADAFGDPIKKGDEFLQTLNALPAVVNAFDAAIQKGDTVGAYGIMLRAAADAANRVEAATGAATDKAKQQAAALEGVANIGVTAAGVEVNVAQAAERLAKASQQIDTDRIAKVAKDMAAAQSVAAGAPAQGAPLDAVRAQLEQYAATHDQTQAAILANEVATWKQRIAVGDLFGKELIDAEAALGRAETAARREAGTEAIAQTRNSIAQGQAEGTRGRTETLQAEIKSWQALLAGDRLTATQRLEIQRQLNQSMAQLHGAERESDLESISIRLQHDEAYFDQKSSHIKELFDLGQLSAAKETVQLKALEDERFAALQRDYQEQLQFQQNDESAQKRTYLELERLTREHNDKIGQLNQQAAKAAQASWEAALQPIKTAFDGMVRGLLQGTLTFQQATKNVLANIVVSYAEMGAKAAVDWVGNQLKMAFASEINAAKSLAQWVAAQLGITAAADTGASDDIAAATTAATTRHTIEAASNVASVTGYAAVAAAAAAASVAAIPYVGWAMAPGVAAETFAMTMAWAPVASAAGGWDIPSASGGIPMIAHSREMVLPANLAEGMRGIIANGSNGGSSSVGDTHIHIHTQASSPDGIAESVKRSVRDFHPAFRNPNHPRRR